MIIVTLFFLPGNLVSDTLRYVLLPVVKNKDCISWVKSYESILKDTMFCAGQSKGKIDSCDGDSGGPLIIGRPSSSQEEEDYGFDEFGFERTASIEDSNIAIIYGIVSFGPKKCGIPGVLGVYTRVTKYLTWIFGHMKGKQYDIVLCLIFCACQYIQLIPILSNHTLFCPVKSKSSPVQPEQPLWTLFTVLLYNKFCAAKGKQTNFKLILHT